MNGRPIQESAHRLNPRNRCDIVKDSVHGYIRFVHQCESGGKTEKDLIDSPWVQRLRRIRQLQAAWHVYPSADHTRFIHALSVMELAGEFAKALYTPYWVGHPQRDELPRPALVVETLRIAGLLHDVGHGPFSHLVDRAYFGPHCDGLNHEKIGAWIIRDKLADLIAGIRSTPDGESLSEDESVDPGVVATLVDSGSHEALPAVWRSLGRIISGAYDADKMDFVLRDGRACGIEGVPSHEVKRLMQTSFLAEVDDGPPVMVLDDSSLIPLCLFLRQRQHLTEAVYHHRTVRKLEREIRSPVTWAVDQIVQKNPLSDRFRECDESEVHARLVKARESGDTAAQEHARRWESAMLRNIPWKMLSDHEEVLTRLPPTQIGPSEIRDRIMAQLADDLGNEDLDEMIWVDVVKSEAPKEVSLVFLHNRLSGQVEPLNLRKLLRRGVFRHKLLHRVYVSASLVPRQDELRAAASQVWRHVAGEYASLVAHS